MEYTKENLSKQKYGKLSFICFTITVPCIPKKGLFLCDCGKLTASCIANVLNSSAKSYGHCNEISKEVMAVTKFGRLRQTTPKDVMPGSNEIDNFTCDCGGNINARIKKCI